MPNEWKCVRRTKTKQRPPLSFSPTQNSFMGSPIVSARLTSPSSSSASGPASMPCDAPASSAAASQATADKGRVRSATDAGCGSSWNGPGVGGSGAGGTGGGGGSGGGTSGGGGGGGGGSSVTSRGPVSKVMDMFRYRSQSMSAEDKRKPQVRIVLSNTPSITGSSQKLTIDVTSSPRRGLSGEKALDLHSLR